jgi:Spy/CpxP family protein refolding chaperone
MQNKYFGFIAAATLATGLLFAQVPGNARRFGPANAPGTLEERCEHRINFLALSLSLTDAQKEQARTIFQTACNQSEALQPFMQQTQQALRDAGKANASSSDIDALAAEVGKLMAQNRAIHTKALAAFYQILTPEQIEKFDQLHAGRMGGPGRHGGALGTHACW